jgi:hypothetical protein
MLETVFIWLRDHEYIAIWLEGIALTLILGLDWKERLDRRSEQREQRKETAAQLAASNSQVDAAKKSADAATEAALAAKKSAEILAGLHRPFVGLSNVTLPLGATTRLWNICFGLKNYGTLPAFSVSLAVEFFTDNELRGRKIDPGSIQIFPMDELTSTIQIDLGDDDLPLVNNGTKRLRLDVRITYGASDGARFEYTARVSYAQGRFQIEKSETH